VVSDAERSVRVSHVRQLSQCVADVSGQSGVIHGFNVASAPDALLALSCVSRNRAGAGPSYVINRMHEQTSTDIQPKLYVRFITRLLYVFGRFQLSFRRKSDDICRASH